MHLAVFLSHFVSCENVYFWQQCVVADVKMPVCKATMYSFLSRALFLSHSLNAMVAGCTEFIPCQCSCAQALNGELEEMKQQALPQQERTVVPVFSVLEQASVGLCSGYLRLAIRLWKGWHAAPSKCHKGCQSVLVLSSKSIDKHGHCFGA